MTTYTKHLVPEVESGWNIETGFYLAEASTLELLMHFGLFHKEKSYSSDEAFELIEAARRNEIRPDRTKVDISIIGEKRIAECFASIYEEEDLYEEIILKSADPKFVCEDEYEGHSKEEALFQLEISILSSFHEVTISCQAICAYKHDDTGILIGREFYGINCGENLLRSAIERFEERSFMHYPSKRNYILGFIHGLESSDLHWPNSSSTTIFE
jgi:hypothetical protein|tara:strand:- start:1044 stop:1685 length:642 start_codon:yes stop_codon:yes gene_type:complete